MIKFRAWDKNQQIMRGVRGLFWTKNNLVAHCSPMGNKFDEFFTTILNDGEYHLMQSTGLKDKNGVEIWVGDILEVRDTSCFGGVYRGAIEHLDNWGVYGFNLFEAKVLSTNKFKKHSIGFLMKEFGNCFTLAEASNKSHYSYEVIGNVYQNPDLIESVEE
ncbi:YopX family protein [Streptococcus agalactiae]|uniref:YopX family protein n=1 Tax=Streptococcus agalactiae TaxID=1311 RepID=UPI002EBB48FA|nr:YopX family protein [Streptococcus agalactiae]MEE3765782.1 YopX family protein [Streptococcus agalactiae]